MAPDLGVELGTAILGGILLGLPPAFLSLWVGKRFDRRWPVTIDTRAGDSAGASFSEEGLPPFLLSLLPVALPVLLVTLVSF